MMMYCNTRRHDGSKVHQDRGKSGQYALDCCSEQLCNNGTTWPALPDVPGDKFLHRPNPFVAVLSAL
jgi:hypothetical protein